VSVDVKLPPETVKEKFLGATQDSFDYSSFIFAGALAGVSQAKGSVPEFHRGAAGVGAITGTPSSIKRMRTTW